MRLRTALISLLVFGVLAAFLAACNNQKEEISSDAFYKIVLKSEVKWDQLNPARGDKSPMAATLWGDRNSTSATGFLLKPTDGFESPPHIHNVSYRGVVISGLIHNDDPNAENMWMPTGSFWTQPKGEVHITSAKGSNTLAYIEIEEGPYLVHPAEDSFHTDEKPINVYNSNIVWLDASNIVWIDHSNKTNSNQKAKVAFLWGKPEKDELNGTLVKLAAGFKGKIQTNSSRFGAVVIKGNPEYIIADKSESKILEAGTYLSSDGEIAHQISTLQETILYVRTEGKYEITIDKD